jgi:hypothetical protein
VTFDATFSGDHVRLADGVGAPSFRPSVSYTSTQFEASRPNKDEGIDMQRIVEPTPRKLRGVRNGNKARLGTGDLCDWLADALRNKPAKEISDDAGCGVRTAENAKQGRHMLSPKHLANLQINDPIFAAAWAEYVGIIRPGEAEFAGAITQAFNAYQRRGSSNDVHD